MKWEAAIGLQLLSGYSWGEKTELDPEAKILAQRASCILGIQSSMDSRSEKVILSPHSGETPSAVLHPAPRYQHRKDMNLLE